jgi:hypothetical protein
MTHVTAKSCVCKSAQFGVGEMFTAVSAKSTQRPAALFKRRAPVAGCREPAQAVPRFFLISASVVLTISSLFGLLQK